MDNTSLSTAAAVPNNSSNAKRAFDDSDQHVGHDDNNNNNNSETPPTIALISRLPPAFLDPASTATTDPSVDPATLAIPQWTGTCSLSLSPAVPHLPLTGGILTVANTRLYWWHVQHQLGFALDYRAMVMHAVQSSTADRESKSVYCQLAVDVRREIGRAVIAAVAGAQAALSVEVNSPEDDQEADAEDDEAFSELTIVPADDAQVDELFSAMSMCASMHPDPMDEDDNDDDEMDVDMDMMMAMMTDNHDVAAAMELSEQGQANLARFGAMLDRAAANGDDQFEDAEEVIPDQPAKMDQASSLATSPRR